MRHIIVLAGGSGTRFWPLSTEDEPKQFLKVYSNRPLIEETFLRLTRWISPRNIYLATGLRHKSVARDAVRKFRIPSANIFFEPEGRNTFAPIALLTSRIYDIDPEAVIIVLPSDHFVDKPDKLLELLNKASQAAQSGYIMTLGMVPDRPETGFGYIKVSPKPKAQSPKLYVVERFVEKPNLKKARQYLKDKKYFWNGGIFIFKAKTMLDEIKRLMPKAYSLIKRMHRIKEVNRSWKKLPKTSVDYAIMEKASRLALIPINFKWIDLGSWRSVEEIMKKDKSGNILKGNTVALDCKNTIVWSGSNKLIAALGLKDIVVVNTKDKLLVCAKDSAQDVRKLVGLLRKKKKV